MPLVNLLLELMVYMAVWWFTPLERTVKACLKRCGPLMLCVVWATVQVVFNVVGHAIDGDPASLMATPLCALQALLGTVGVAVWLMGGRRMESAEIRVTVIQPAMASSVGGVGECGQRRQLHERFADWWNRQPAPRALRVAVGGVLAVIVLVFVHLYKEAVYVLPYVVGGSVWVWTASRANRP